MIVYCLLLLPVAIIAYFLGSMDTIALASNFVFRKNLMRLGRGNLWIANFRRVYGLVGFIKLLLTELVRDALPILLGGLVLSFKGHAEVGLAFAAFCLTLGRLYPVLYDFKGSHASFCMAVGAMFINPSAGIAVLVVIAAVTLISKFITVGTVAGALVLIPMAILMVDDALVRKLLIFMAIPVVIKHIPSLLRIAAGREEKLAIIHDVTYKFDEKF